MTDELAARRRFYAEELEAVANLRSVSLVEALASVPREAFLPPGPWVVFSEADLGRAARQTADADPRRVYHNLSLAVDPARRLFNGAPGVVAPWIDALALEPGQRVLHVGCGAGYYTAVLAECVGKSGRVVAIEIDPGLADAARRNLAPWPVVEVRCSDATDVGDEAFDAILVNAGMTHPPAAWLGALRPGGRMALPLSATMPAMGTLGKGFVFLLRNTSPGRELEARPLTMVVIYSAVGIRDDHVNELLGKALMRTLFPRVSRLRLDPHDAVPACWCHAPTWCLSS